MQSLRQLLGIALLGLGALSAVGCDEDDPTTPIDDDPPGAPANLVVVETNGAAVLTWAAVTGADSYTVERSVEDAAYAELASGLTVTTYTDEAVDEGVEYEYRVRAINDNGASVPSEDAPFEIGLRVAELTGTISGTRTLRSDTTYTLRGVVRVDSGSVLVIEPGTLILGDANTQPTALYIAPGGMIDAQGTAAAPIVFTSSRPAGSRQPGDWGGIFINGRGQCNFTTQPCLSEGIFEEFGGDDNDASSGIMTYVRIEFVGYEVSAGNELNGLTLNGVGGGTVLHHIQVHRGLDDGFEWFGGAADLKYGIVTGASDDSFDFSSGWIGRGQFWIAQADPDDADRGFEVDNNESDNDALPRTDWQVYNVTLVGKAPGSGTPGEAPVGMTLRLGTAGIVRNAIVLGYETGLDVDNAATFAQCAAGELEVGNTIFFGNGNQYSTDADDETECVDAATIRTIDPLLGDPFNLAAPNFIPATASPAATGAATPPADGFFDSVDYVGAVEPGATTAWYQGWTTAEWE